MKEEVKNEEMKKRKEGGNERGRDRKKEVDKKKA